MEWGSLPYEVPPIALMGLPVQEMNQKKQFDLLLKKDKNTFGNTLNLVNLWVLLDKLIHACQLTTKNPARTQTSFIYELSKDEYHWLMKDQNSVMYFMY